MIATDLATIRCRAVFVTFLTLAACVPATEPADESIVILLEDEETEVDTEDEGTDAGTRLDTGLEMDAGGSMDSGTASEKRVIELGSVVVSVRYAYNANTDTAAPFRLDGDPHQTSMNVILIDPLYDPAAPDAEKVCGFRIRIQSDSLQLPSASHRYMGREGRIRTKLFGGGPQLMEVDDYEVESSGIRGCSNFEVAPSRFGGRFYEWVSANVPIAFGLANASADYTAARDGGVLDSPAIDQLDARSLIAPANVLVGGYGLEPRCYARGFSFDERTSEASLTTVLDRNGLWDSTGRNKRSALVFIECPYALPAVATTGPNGPMTGFFSDDPDFESPMGGTALFDGAWPPDVLEQTQGGIIVDVDEGFTTGLVAAPADILDPVDGDRRMQWGCNSTNVVGADSPSDGQSNTQDIVAARCTRAGPAAACNALIYEGFSDWYLPAPEEMDLIHREWRRFNLEETYFYWTSQELSIADARSYSWPVTPQWMETPKGASLRARCVRRYTWSPQ